MTEQSSEQFKSGFIALIGRPNSGKSTLLNMVLQEELCVVTPMPQTTRKNLKGIYSSDSCQLIFVDTPGMHKGGHRLNEVMLNESVTLLRERGVDVLCYLVDLSRDFGEEEDLVAGHVQEAGTAVLVVFNKADACGDVAGRRDAFLKRYPGFAQAPSVTVAALDKSYRDAFLAALMPFVPDGPPWYPTDELTDENLRYFAREYLQKGIILNSRSEVPHASLVEILAYSEEEQRHVIDAVIHVETRGQRGILVGTDGSIIRKIRRIAEKAMHQLTGVQVQYRCHVKVTPKWRDKTRFLNEMGYSSSQPSQK
jgi:GTP-binding protein Era